VHLLGPWDPPKPRCEAAEQMVAGAERFETNIGPINECAVDLFRK